MSSRSRIPKRLHGSRHPTGALRRLFRAPEYLYRWKCGWLLGRRFLLLGNRRLAKDSENLAETLAIFVSLASIQLAVRRLARA